MKREPTGSRAFVRFMPVYAVGFVVGVALLVLRFFGIWRIKGMENMPSLQEKGDRGLIVVSNHPSLLEPIALIGLFFSWYLLHPFKYGPWNMPEVKNYRRGVYKLLEQRLVFVDREKKISGGKALVQAIKLLKSGAVFLLFPEGGRTSSAKPDDVLIEKGTRRMRSFEPGAAQLALRTGAIVLPIWVEGTDHASPRLANARLSFPRFWKRVTISIGEKMVVSTDTPEERVTEILQNAVLSA
jgi:1-acyl-sn-glycerol-3-phosphate acyltransferase